MMFSKIFTALFLTSIVGATVLPAATFRKGGLLKRDNSAVSILEAIAPTSTSCAGAPVPSECATATQAAPFLVEAFSNYSITSVNEISGILALIAYESGEFKYSVNHYPGRPGQGTRNMQMANYNLLYARSIPALSGPLAAITTATTTDGLTTDQLNQILALVDTDEYGWASGAWFLTTQCQSIRSQLQAGGTAGFTAYMGCVQTDASDDRLAYFTRATQAFAT
ncbi:hypothetical protein B7494_g6520 [Chlorociboria aeruginascens]|nr:hypothetical protein B7494_g6520 [Chlorociboria aeruginascens]